MEHSSLHRSAAALHDAYAASYDSQVCAYDCYIADALFGLSYEVMQPGQSVLDLGIGTGLSAQPLFKAGLRIYGADFSSEMLEVCRAKGITADLKQFDLTRTPWPYPAQAFDHVVCCGVFHFIPDLDGIFSETTRILRPGGSFSLTTKVPKADSDKGLYEKTESGEFDIYSHSDKYMQTLFEQYLFIRFKQMKCFVGDELHRLWVIQRRSNSV